MHLELACQRREAVVAVTVAEPVARLAVLVYQLHGLLAQLAIAIRIGNIIAPASTPAADETYPLWVGEAQVTSTNLEGQGWSFAPAANGNPATLTLSDYSYTGPGHVETLQDYDGEWDYYRHAPIFWNDGSALVVELAGESGIVVTADPAAGSASESGAGEDGGEDEDPTHRYCGIFCAGESLTVRGAGNLAANAGAMEDGDAGIFAKGDVSIEGGSVSVIQTLPAPRARGPLRPTRTTRI